jgi:hypothetical protein
LEASVESAFFHPSKFIHGFVFVWLEGLFQMVSKGFCFFFIVPCPRALVFSHLRDVHCLAFETLVALHYEYE